MTEDSRQRVGTVLAPSLYHLNGKREFVVKSLLTAVDKRHFALEEPESPSKDNPALGELISRMQEQLNRKGGIEAVVSPSLPVLEAIRHVVRSNIPLGYLAKNGSAHDSLIIGKSKDLRFEILPVEHKAFPEKIDALLGQTDQRYVVGVVGAGGNVGKHVVRELVKLDTVRHVVALGKDTMEPPGTIRSKEKDSIERMLFEQVVVNKPGALLERVGSYEEYFEKKPDITIFVAKSSAYSYEELALKNQLSAIRTCGLEYDAKIVQEFARRLVHADYQGIVLDLGNPLSMFLEIMYREGLRANQLFALSNDSRRAAHFMLKKKELLHTATPALMDYVEAVVNAYGDHNRGEEILVDFEKAQLLGAPDEHGKRKVLAFAASALDTIAIREQIHKDTGNIGTELFMKGLTPTDVAYSVTEFLHRVSNDKRYTYPFAATAYVSLKDIDGSEARRYKNSTMPGAFACVPVHFYREPESGYLRVRSAFREMGPQVRKRVGIIVRDNILRREKAFKYVSAG